MHSTCELKRRPSQRLRNRLGQVAAVATNFGRRPPLLCPEGFLLGDGRRSGIRECPIGLRDRHCS